jgi:hypothetical protein
MLFTLDVDPSEIVENDGGRKNSNKESQKDNLEKDQIKKQPQSGSDREDTKKRKRVIGTAYLERKHPLSMIIKFIHFI